MRIILKEESLVMTYHVDRGALPRTVLSLLVSAGIFAWAVVPASVSAQDKTKTEGTDQQKAGAKPPPKDEKKPDAKPQPKVEKKAEVKPAPAPPPNPNDP